MPNPPVPAAAPDDPQPPLTPAEKGVRAWLRTLLREELLAAMKEIASSSPSALRGCKQADMSIADICTDYRVGRTTVKAMIASGELPAHRRRTRGGKIGTFVLISDAAKVLTWKGKA